MTTEVAPARFHAADLTYFADTCEPLKEAAGRGELQLRGWAHGAYPGYHAPRGVLPELASVGAWDAKRDQRWGLDWHRNEGIELTYVSHGRLRFACQERQWTLEPGDLALTRPWQPHRIGDPHITASRAIWVILDIGVRHPGQSWRWPPWLIFSREDLEQLEILIRTNHQPVWRHQLQVGDHFDRLADIIKDPEHPGTDTRLALTVNALLVAVWEGLSSGQAEPGEPRTELPADATVSAVAGLLEHLKHDLAHPWTLDELAKSCGIGRTQFSKHCLKLTNTTPMRYLTRLRVEAAKHLLTTAQNQSIAEIAQYCGFGTSQYFATVFRQQTGLSPTRYQQMRRCD